MNCFHEKPDGDNAWINGGFFVLNPAVIDLISGDDVMWEREPLQALAAQGELTAYRHNGFWQPMDTLRDRQMLEQLWEDQISLEAVVMLNPQFWTGRRVLLTGHTGFKGSWLALA